jgi:hypothetical protein
MSRVCDSNNSVNQHRVDYNLYTLLSMGNKQARANRVRALKLLKIQATLFVGLDEIDHVADHGMFVNGAVKACMSKDLE